MISDEPMLSLIERLKTWWTAADRNQRVVTLGGIGALLLLLVGTAFFVTRPHYETLLSDLSDSEKGQVVESLTGMGIPAQYGRAGVVEVPADKVAEARMKLASTGKLPKGTVHWSPSDMTKAGPFTSPEVEAQTLKTVLEGEIATTLESMEGVASAQVLITSPKQRVFSDDKQSPTASVTIVEDGRGMLTADNGRTIANLVCSAVDGMKPEDVVVVSNAMGELWNGKSAQSSGNKADLDGKVAHEWEAKLQAALDVPFGAGNTKVVVRADVDTARRHVTEHEVIPTPKATSVVSEEEIMKNASRTAGGAAGATSNTSPAEPPKNGASGKDYEKKGTSKTYDTSHTVRETEEGTGDLKGLAITVIANSDKVSDPAKVKEIVDGVMGGKIELDDQGKPKKNQPFTTSVTSVKFDGSAAQAAKDATDRLASQQRMQQLLSLLPIAAILVVALLVAKQVGKISRAVLPARVPELASPAEEDPRALPNVEGVSALPRPATVAEFDEPVALEQFKDRVDVPLQSLKQMAAERPEMVATLIKSMMLGERA